MTPFEKARVRFSEYQAMDKPKLPTDQQINMSALQVDLCRWHHRNFDRDRDADHALGISEEVGELTEALLGLMAASGRISHAVLKNSQGIRGMGDEAQYRAAIADAVADSQIFATQLCTLLRIDFGTLYKETAEEVMKREWKK